MVPFVRTLAPTETGQPFLDRSSMGVTSVHGMVHYIMPVDGEMLVGTWGTTEHRRSSPPVRRNNG